MYDNEKRVADCEPEESAKAIVGETFKAEAEALACLMQLLRDLNGNAKEPGIENNPTSFIEALRMNRVYAKIIMETAREIGRTLFS